MSGNGLPIPILKVSMDGNIDSSIPAMSVKIATSIPTISAKVNTSSSEIDYAIVKQMIESYVNKLQYVSDVDIEADGTITIDKN